MKRWSFRCWICGNFEIGPYIALPKRLCPRCNSHQTTLKQLDQQPEPTAPEREEALLHKILGYQPKKGNTDG